jgi:hypothetical protein
MDYYKNIVYQWCLKTKNYKPVYSTARHDDDYLPEIISTMTNFSTHEGNDCKSKKLSENLTDGDFYGANVKSDSLNKHELSLEENFIKKLQLKNMRSFVLRTSPELVRTSPELVRTSPELVRSSPKLVRSSPELVRSSPELVRTSPELVRTSPELVTPTSSPTIESHITPLKSRSIFQEEIILPYTFLVDMSMCDIKNIKFLKNIGYVITSMRNNGKQNILRLLHSYKKIIVISDSKRCDSLKLSIHTDIRKCINFYTDITFGIQAHFILDFTS